MKKKSLKKDIHWSIVLKLSIVFIAIFFVFVLMNFALTGKISLSLNPQYLGGEILGGAFNLNVQEGELIPLDSQIIVINGDVERIFNFSDFVNGGDDRFVEKREKSLLDSYCYLGEETFNYFSKLGKKLFNDFL